MSPTFDDVHREKYLLLTTFTKDGRPKPTPVWGVPHDGKLLISTDDGSWKTKRINKTRRVFNMVTRRYWWHAWWWIPQAIVRGGVDKVHAAIEVQAVEDHLS